MPLQHSQHGQHGQHGQANPEAGDGLDNGVMLTAAMMRTRDAIVGTETIAPPPGVEASLPIADRLRRLTAEHRRAVLTSELLEDLRFLVEDHDLPRATARAVTVRLVGIPGHGQVSDSALVRIVRPEVAQFSRAVPLVAAYAELRADRLSEIMVQKSQLIAFAAGIMPINPTRNPAIAEMLEVALEITTPVVMRIKIALGCPRPSVFSDRIQPMIAEPAHPALPSGHATQIFTLATVLSLLAAPDAGVVGDSQIYRLACRIAMNRTVAGLHFPVDSAAGAVLGIQLGRYLMARGQVPGGRVSSAAFDGTLFEDGSQQPRDFHFGVLDRMMKGVDSATDFCSGNTAVAPAPLWQSLCRRAVEEWASRWS